VFWLSVGLLLYVLFGYPILLGLVANVKARPIRKLLQTRTVTVLLPVRNGEQWIREKLESILNLKYPRSLLQVVVISDGSTDLTETIAAEFTEGGGVELLSLPSCGKAAALNAGILKARGEILFLTDVRQELHENSLTSLVSCFADPSVGVASGQLVIRPGETFAERSVGAYWKYETWIRKNESALDSVIGATGCIYAIRRDLAVALPQQTLADDLFIPLAAFFKGYRIILDESATAYDCPMPLDTEFRRKLRTQAGVWQALRAYPELLSIRNRMLFSFLSHKFGRLILPYCLISIAAATGLMKTEWKYFGLWIQVLFYGLALLDLGIPERCTLRRMTSLPRTFCVLIAASFWAPWSDIRNTNGGWRETRVPRSCLPGDTQ
jgi:poly-beta-1,6-N-acetyl-D-glucosamine synthase